MVRQVTAAPQARPEVVPYDGILVVRDDLFLGGTKARFLRRYTERVQANEYVYASPAEGGAQTSLAHVLGSRVTIVVAKRKKMHARTKAARKLGAKIIQVGPCGYMSVVKAHARKYAERRKAHLFPFGIDLPETVEVIAEAARSLGFQPDEIWCAAGSGTLARGLALAWPHAKRHVVQVGRPLSSEEVAGATIHIHPRKFGQEAKSKPPFPADPHYEAKAWETCLEKHGPGTVIFWSVMGPPT